MGGKKSKRSRRILLTVRDIEDLDACYSREDLEECAMRWPTTPVSLGWILRESTTRHIDVVWLACAALGPVTSFRPVVNVLAHRWALRSMDFFVDVARTRKLTTVLERARKVRASGSLSDMVEACDRNNFSIFGDVLRAAIELRGDGVASFEAVSHYLVSAARLRADILDRDVRRAGAREGLRMRKELTDFVRV